MSFEVKVMQCGCLIPAEMHSPLIIIIIIIVVVVMRFISDKVHSYNYSVTKV